MNAEGKASIRTEPVTPNSGDQPPDPSASANDTGKGKAQETTAKPPKPSKPRERAPRKPPLEKQLEETFATISLAIMATGDEYCARHVAAQAAPLAEAWAELAKINPRVRAVLERMMQGSAWSAVIVTTAATVIPIAAHHGLYPKGFPMPFEFGLGPPPPPSQEVQREREHGDTPATGA